MTSVDELRALKTQVEAAAGADREIERKLCIALLAPPVFADQLGPTTSIDAALGLVERVFPTSVWSVQTDHGGLCRAHIDCDCDERPGPYFTEDGETPPLAILSALLSALIARAEKEGDGGG